MRSPRAFAGALVLLLGVPLAILAQSAFEGAAGIIIHLALGGSFFLLALSVFDFGLPKWIALVACAAIAVLAAVFFFQGVSDLLASAPLRHLAYEVLGQRLEKGLGYAFLLWCLAVLVLASSGKTRVFGLIVAASVLGVEIYSFALAHGGGAVPEVLKLLYLPLFIWLLLEGLKPGVRRAAPS